MHRFRLALACLATASLAAGCTGSPAPAARGATSAAPATRSASAALAPSSAAGSTSAVHGTAREPGGRWLDLPMPSGSYRPQAPAGGTDDYRCILLDPKIRADAFLAGAALEPGNPKLVHHAILYRVEPGQVAAARARDAADPRLGWSCFGGPDLPGGAGVLGGLNAAPWVAAWATSGGVQRFAAGTGQRLKAGSRLILQMHYNLLNGGGTDDTAVRLLMARRGAHVRPLETMLLPAPVELPCPRGKTGPLCDRTASVLDVERRFGTAAGFTVAGLQLLCGGSPTKPKAGRTQTCARPVPGRIRIRAVAGHMHLLGRSIRIDLVHPDGTGRRLLNVPVWNFDDQHATVLAKPVTVNAGDQLRVTCTHDAKLRDLLPELAKLPPRYVVWGEGSSDEMCLGIVSYTRA